MSTNGFEDHASNGTVFENAKAKGQSAAAMNSRPAIIMRIGRGDAKEQLNQRAPSERAGSAEYT